MDLVKTTKLTQTPLEGPQEGEWLTVFQRTRGQVVPNNCMDYMVCDGPDKHTCQSALCVASIVS